MRIVDPILPLLAITLAVAIPVFAFDTRAAVQTAPAPVTLAPYAVPQLPPPPVPVIDAAAWDAASAGQADPEQGYADRAEDPAGDDPAMYPPPPAELAAAATADPDPAETDWQARIAEPTTAMAAAEPLADASAPAY